MRSAARVMEHTGRRARFVMTVGWVFAFAFAALHPASSAFASPLIPMPPQSHPIAITHATIHTVSGGVIPDGTVLFDHGAIVAVGTDVAPPRDASIVNASGKHVYPGLFAAYSTIGLREIDQARATDDLTEVGEIHPEVRAEIAYNTDSEHIPVTRSNGILTALVVPQGGFLSGRAAIMRLDAWTLEDAVVKAPAALQVAWPAAPIAAPDWTDERRANEDRAYDERVARIRRAFADARAYQVAHAAGGRAGARPPDVDQRWEAMLPVLRGEEPVLVYVDAARDIETAVAWALDEHLSIILAGAVEAGQVLDLLRRNDIPVIITNVLREPSARDADYDQPFTLAEKLHAAGIRFAIGDAGAGWNLRNLPYDAAMCVAYGLPPDEALKAITLYPAELFGVADRLGSIEPGRSATLFIADGDILEIPTQVEAAWMDGRPVDLDNRHKALDRKYRQKYRQLGLMH